MTYIPLQTTSIDYAHLLSQRLWEMTRPLSVRREGDTIAYCSVIAHPQTLEVALCFDGVTQMIHPLADPSRLTEILTLLTEQQKQDMISQIDSTKGMRIDPVIFIPDNFSKLTDEVALSDGWFDLQESKM